MTAVIILDRLDGQEFAIANGEVLQFSVVHQLSQRVFPNSRDAGHLYCRLDEGVGTDAASGCLFPFHGFFLLLFELYLEPNLSDLEHLYREKHCGTTV